MNASYDYESLRPSLGLIPAYDALQRHPHLDGDGIELAMDFEFLALECGADPSWDREKLVKHQKARAGRKGGLTTFARYGRPYYRALARVRWGETPRGALGAIRDALATTPAPRCQTSIERYPDAETEHGAKAPAGGGEEVAA